MKTISEQLELARKAQEAINDYTQEQVDEMCLSVGWEVYEDENIARLARMAVEETGFGNVESKIVKHKRKVGGVLHDIRGAKSVGCIERDEKRLLMALCAAGAVAGQLFIHNNNKKNRGTPPQSQAEPETQTGEEEKK